MTSNKDLNRVIKKAIERGWKLKRQSRHLIFQYTNKRIVIVSKTPKKGSVHEIVKKDFEKKEMMVVC